jgi:uncharacterized membrane protein
MTDYSLLQLIYFSGTLATLGAVVFVFIAFGEIMDEVFWLLFLVCFSLVLFSWVGLALLSNSIRHAVRSGEVVDRMNKKGK